MPLDPATRLGRYEIRTSLGKGGMGEVYLAFDSQLRRLVALKILPTRFTSSENRLDRFRREAYAVSALNHPNIITIHEIGLEGDTHFIVTEFVEGESLRQRFENSRIEIVDVLEITIQAAAALTAAHQAGIIHRDIKPENIMVRKDGIIKVLDFGLAKLNEEKSSSDPDAPTVPMHSTGAGSVMGTTQYMSPEQARGQKVDARTDIWSLGVLLYEGIAGHPPFKGSTSSDTIAEILKTEPHTLVSYNSQTPIELQRIVKKALRKDRENRYQTIKDMALDLKSLKRELEIAAEMPPPVRTQLDQLKQEFAEKGDKSVAHVALEASRLDSVRNTAPFPSVGERFSAGLKNPRKIVIAALAIILVAAAAISIGLLFRERKIPAPNKSQADMVAIPGGTFLMGRDENSPFGGMPTEVPAHAVTVSSFSMDRTEVTNKEYAEFIRETNYPAPITWVNNKPTLGDEQWPVTSVSIADAIEFAAWRSKRDGTTYRLPSEEEWEYAARGGDLDNFYPWGSIWIQGRANVGSDSAKPVGSYPEGKTRWGVLDMIGNVWEWTSSRANIYPGGTVRLVPGHEDWIVARGGSYLSKPIGARGVTTTLRDWFPATSKDPVLGFRLVRTGS
jgi:eukaryotic-like serine/threonine-protein kinase